MTGQGEPRRDLAAMLYPLARSLIAAELPVLARHGISMWGYVVLNALDGSPARTQAALAQAIGADKTRIIEAPPPVNHSRDRRDTDKLLRGAEWGRK